MSNVTEHLSFHGFNCIEGHIQQVNEQVNDLVNIVNSFGKKKLNIMEIGFNGGHSSELFLSCNNETTVVSFDLGDHDYVSIAKEYINNKYPNRHRLITGDSKRTVPNFIYENRDVKFDIIFVDGGHDYMTAKEDMLNCFYLSHKDTVVILDDTVFIDPWRLDFNRGPTSVWYDFLYYRRVKEIYRKDYCHGRGMAWGNYIHE